MTLADECFEDVALRMPVFRCHTLTHGNIHCRLNTS
jgi:hypothetical protein